MLHRAKVFTKKVRAQRIENLVKDVEDWDLETLLSYAQEARREQLENMTDEELIEIEGR